MKRDVTSGMWTGILVSLHTVSWRPQYPGHADRKDIVIQRLRGILTAHI